MTTTFEDEGVRYEVEQFAYPLHGPPSERRGDMPMVLLQQLTITELNGTPRTLPVSMTHRRQLPPHFDGTIVVERRGETVLFRERGRGGVLLAIEGAGGETPWNGTEDYQRPPQKRIDTTVFVDLPARGSRQFVVKLPSPTRLERRNRRADGHRLRQGPRCDAGVLVGLRRARRAVPRARPGRQRALPRQPLARAPAAASSRRSRAGRRHRPAVLELRLRPDRHAVAGQSGRVRGLHALRPARIPRHFRPKSSRSSSATTRKPTAT